MVMTLITPDSLELIRNDESALRRVHRSAPFARRSGAVAALAARGAGRDHALADANRVSAAQPLGRRLERLGEEALQQGIEDAEQSLGEQEAKLEAAQPAAQRPAKPAKRHRGSLPEHLPRVEVVVDIADKACACCGASLHTIGEDRSEMLDYVPAQIRVQLIRRPRYGWRACEGAVVQAPAPERPI